MSPLPARMEAAKLSILHTNFHRGWGGQPARILMLSMGQARRGHRVVISAPEGSILAERSRKAGLETFEEPRYRKPKHFLSAVRDARQLDRLLRAEPIDLIDAHGSQDLWAAAVARMLGRHRTPLVFTRHNTKEVADHPVNRYLYRRSIDHLIVASGSVLDRYDLLLRRGDLSRDRVSIVHSAFWEDRFHPEIDGSAVRGEILGDRASDGILVGVIGRLVPDKGGIYFLRAAAKLREEFPQARFLFVGVGDGEPTLRAAVQELGIDDRVRFLGFRDDVPQVMAALDLLVLPSIDCDASSGVLKEAMAVGRPVVATAIGGAAEIIDEGRTGLVVPPADPERLAEAMREILSRPDRGRDMGRLGQERVSSFSQDRLVEGTLEAYRRVLERVSHQT